MNQQNVDDTGSLTHANKDDFLELFLYLFAFCQSFSTVFKNKYGIKTKIKCIHKDLFKQTIQKTKQISSFCYKTTITTVLFVQTTEIVLVKNVDVARVDLFLFILHLSIKENMLHTHDQECIEITFAFNFKEKRLSSEYTARLT